MAVESRLRTGTDIFGVLEAGVAAATLLALGVRQFIGNGVTSGYLLAVLLLPVWVMALRRFWGARAFMVLGIVSIMSGLILSGISASHHQISATGVKGESMLLIGTLCGIGVVLWCRQVLSVGQIGLWFGLGMLVSAALGPGRSSANAWKFAWAIPIAVIGLSLAHQSGRRYLEFVTLLLLAGISAVLDSRSYFATFLLAAVLVGWQMRPRILTKSASWWWTALLMAAIAVGIYYLGTALLLNGALGQVAQLRSIQQIDSAGSLILGGRPELAATVSLFRGNPLGFGAGVIPNFHDVSVAKAGMAAINYDPNNGYVEIYMMGGHFELHSVVGDMWATYGLAGIALTLVIAFLVVRGLALGLSDRAASAVLIFLSCWTLWNLMFSPIFSSAPTLMLGIGLALVAQSTSTAASKRDLRAMPGQRPAPPPVFRARTAPASRPDRLRKSGVR